MTFTRRLPVGAEVVPSGVHVRVWAPKRRRVELVLERAGSTATHHELASERTGYFSGVIEGMGAGSLYRFRLDGQGPFPDPASRFQPGGPHGPSRVVDPGAYRWSDRDWKGIELRGQVLYELHIGTFTRQGTWAAATEALSKLRGICTAVEVLPVADFAGDFGWGYDGVNLFAPTRLYGTPDDLRAFVDHAHALGLGVLLDVVYNHLGPDGNYLTQFSDDYFSRRHATEWGPAINYDGENSANVREFVVANAGYWIDEFHFDGLRLDATQSMFDDSTPHVLAEIGERVRGGAAGRKTIVVVENEPQDTTILRSPESGGHGLDAAWNDDFHHSAFVALTGHADAYYSDHRGTAQELLSAMKHGYLFQGQRYAWQRKRRGGPAFGIPPERFVVFLENHDQVANSGRGDRIHRRVSPGRLRAMRGLLMLGPCTPLLFQGEEYGSSARFTYFAHHEGELARLVRSGRAEFMTQFPALKSEEARSKLLDDPASRATFDLCKLDAGEREHDVEFGPLFRDLFALRQGDPTVRGQAAHGMDGAVLAQGAFVLRLFGSSHEGDRLLVVNLGPDCALIPAPEPLLAPPEGCRWSLLWSSDDLRYGGDGSISPETDEGWRLRGESTVLLRPERDAR
jgi:maltooligosyltrehalose trehalohydrolase